MRVAVVGASGNAGTALLRRLRDDDVVAVARRAPHAPPPEPYDVARWVACDLGAADGEVVVRTLSEAFAGCDAVVHLGWQIQPSHDRDRLRRTNVVGTRRVVEAVERAEVGHLVVASSVGVYSPVDDDRLRDEDAPRRGVRSSGYSVDKVAQEDVLDDAVRRLPGLRVARLRPGLLFQRPAGASIERYFLGPVAPARLLGALTGRVPVLPWPQGVRLQALHTDDVAAAYEAVLRTGASGPFNVAADDVLDPVAVAEVLGAARVVPVPVPVVRGLLGLAWDLRALHPDPGWVDLAGGVPLMDTGRARSALGWSPRWSAADALADLVDGLARGTGTASPPLRPRHRARPSAVGGQASPT